MKELHDEGGKFHGRVYGKESTVLGGASVKENQKDFFAVLGRRSTKKILEFLDSHDNVQLDNLTRFATPFALKRLLQELMEFNLIKCCVQMDDEKKVWYELTEKGAKILHALRELERILRSSHTRVR
ncbi:MAG: hypothetical protein HXS48_14005 [Theionarchaea archaeon]|nr:hypothetical protein [Theionarchaea archaeon]